MSLEQAREWIASARRIVGFTGAGISTESGIPDFRSPNGVWARNRTVYFQEFVSNEEDRIEAWRQKVETWPSMRDAKPNPGHYAFVELARLGRLQAMITQNIDGLHQRSGLDPRLILELHGTTIEAACLSCGHRIPMDEAVDRVKKGELAPRCLPCGGLLKPATISFGQTLPENVLQQCQAASQSCDVFLAVGSSLVVYPAAGFPALAKQAGARLIIVNRTETPLDEIADIVLREEIGKVLPAIVEKGDGAFFASASDNK
jgi:NAD-dependent deacetylase